MSESRTNIYVALAAAQALFAKVEKGSVNSHFRTKYADLSDIVQAVAPALASQGIAFWHHIEDGCMVTTLMHGESETSVSCSVPLIVDRQNMQAFKSATTYAKRIGLESVTGVAPEDDDGNRAAAAPPAQQQPQRPPQPPASPTQDQIEAQKQALRYCKTVDELKTAFIEMKAAWPAIARRDDVIALKDEIKASLSAAKEAAE